MEGKNFPTGDRIAMEVLVINGIALYASWVLYNSFQGTAIVLKYTAKVEDEIACTIVLAGLASTLLFWFLRGQFCILEVYCVHRYALRANDCWIHGNLYGELG